jgi:hypothetical protein
MEKFFLPIFDSNGEESGSWTFTLRECPYRLTRGEYGPLCHAIMNLEQQLVRELGGELRIETRIAEGASVCRFTVLATQAPQARDQSR